MKPPDFDYQAPTSIEDALRILGEDPDAKLLAGGQSLIPLLGLRLAFPSSLVDLRRVPGLDAVESSDGTIRMGAMVRQRQAEHDQAVRVAAPLLTAALPYVAHPQIRSRGTLGGSIAHADPAAELPAVLVALDGRVRAAGRAGERILPAADLFTGFLSTALADDEIITAIELDCAPPRTGAACVEVAQRAGDYALCGAVAQVVAGEDGRASEARVALFGISDRPVRARACEAAVMGKPMTASCAAAAARHAPDAVTPIDDPQAPVEYRRHLAEVVARRALAQAMEQASR